MLMRYMRESKLSRAQWSSLLAWLSPLFPRDSESILLNGCCGKQARITKASPCKSDTRVSLARPCIVACQSILTLGSLGKD